VCCEREKVDVNPLAFRNPGKKVERERALTDDELRSVWQAAETMGYPFGKVVQLLILTGARRGEVAGLRFTELRDDAIHLEGERTKTGKAHTTPLSSTARGLIDDAPRFEDCPYVFTTNGRTAVSGWTKAKRRLDDLIAIANAERRLSEVPTDEDAIAPWRLHDIRRTVATGLQRLGTRLEVIEAVLGHVSGSRAGIVGLYQRHSFDPEKRAALEAWAAHVARIIGQEAAKVVKLR
jgi:integrase